LNPECSICITHYNDAQTVKECLDSILDQIDDRFEVVIADQRSTDGSRQILDSYAQKGRVRVIDMRVRNRGLGRQEAFEKSTGEYVIASIDLDNNYRPILSKLLRAYKDLFEGKIVRFGTLEISRRDVLQKIGGWRDLQWGEDIEHWARAAKAGLFVVVPRPEVAFWTKPFGRGRNRWGMMKYRYEMMRDLRRMGRHRWDKVVDSPHATGKAVMFALMIAGTIGALFKTAYHDPWNNLFKISGYDYQGKLDIDHID
jgi:glycosyltransferase involved in cell wall biosynthesis